MAEARGRLPIDPTSSSKGCGVELPLAWRRRKPEGLPRLKQRRPIAPTQYPARLPSLSLPGTRPGSYRPGLRQYRCTGFLRQGLRGQYIDLHPEQLPQLYADRSNIEECCLGRRINQQIKIALLSILAVQHRTEDPSIRGPVGFDYAPDRLAMAAQGL